MKLQFPFLTTEKKFQHDEDYFIEIDRKKWREERSVLTATELYSSLFVKGLYDDFEYKETLNYLLSIFDKLPRGTQNLISSEPRQVDKSQTYTTNPDDVRIIIRKLKNIVNIFPTDAMTWVDIAFYYTILGELSKAEKCFLTAWGINKDNSFIARSYSRFLVHLNNPEKAIHVLRKCSQINTNPLVSSAAIAIANSFNIKGREINIGKKLVDSFIGESSFNSDLSACIGTLELMNGNTKKAKILFKKALAKPSENTISQYNWLFHKHNFSIDGLKNGTFKSIESEVNDSYVTQQYEKCRNGLIELHNFQPFSEAPISDAGYISLVALNDPKYVIGMSHNRVPRVHMPFIELNNLIVAKLLSNDFSDIELEMRLLARKLQTSDQKGKGIYLATSGLIFFKTENFEKGVKCYEDAINYFKSINSTRSAVLAEHFYSQQIRDINPNRYASLRKSVQSFAKTNKMLELILPEEK
ncbi:MAG TPA: hypothetical protein DG048_20780 [Pseudoalteromonas sp.]|nr:hypothetical protein [Pseudoalteromonas sp.]|tara:strand:- start:1545 stop:2954 length:1410 start_codon:yes stop_codon:yes gene_type:complete